MAYTSQSIEELTVMRDNALQTVRDINAELELRLTQASDTITDLNNQMTVLEAQNNEAQQLRGLVQQLFSHVQNNEAPKPKARGKAKSSPSVESNESKPAGRGRGRSKK